MISQYKSVVEKQPYLSESNNFESILSNEKKEFLEKNGYVIIEDAAPTNLCNSSVDAICEFLDISRIEPSSWYKERPLNSIGLVPLHQHPAFWDIRQHPKIYNTFRHLLGEDELWVTMDRASFRPPCRYDLEAYGNDENPMHWDYDFRLRNKNLYQGLIYLTDTHQNQGAFACVPSVYKKIRDGKFEHANALEKFGSKGLFLRDVMEFTEKDIITIDAPAGSLIIWDARLPHGCVSNHYHMPRFVQFITMFRADDIDSIPTEVEQSRDERIDCFMKMRAPECHRNLNGQPDPEPYNRAKLSSLGEKLLGVKRW
ncbi:phytanoyl-CoA dioxygenase family protein [Enterovibrio makurazakiensis]|uniref:phytanoyl-CoA dioxygenase family protein n=1 Tax=Enterovibrio makurazakiensis TaxID=2910232 RepID=UPI003D23C051